jgi:hypothetical protein
MNDISNLVGIILVFFASIRIIVGIKGRKWLVESPKELEIEGYSKERTNNLTLSGFALAAIALFLTIGFSEMGIDEISVSDTVFFLSISLVVFIISAYFYNFSMNRVYPFIAVSLEWIGLLSIGIGLFLFFADVFSSDLRFIFLYAIFFGLVFYIGHKDVQLYVKFFKKS